MGKPSTQQIAEAIIHSARSGESDSEFDARIAGLSRLSDEELAAMGIFPHTPMSAQESCPEPVEKVAKLTKLTVPRFSFFRIPRALR